MSSSFNVGVSVAIGDGTDVGVCVGITVGSAVGEVGAAVGKGVGEAVGTAEGWLVVKLDISSCIVGSAERIDGVVVGSVGRWLMNR